MAILTCYNKACSTKGKFEESENGEEACRFHPGGPVFHDALKGWSCCKKRVTDFGEFLAIPGCTAGAHNPVKSQQPVKVESKNSGAKDKPDFSKERDAKNYGTEKIISAPPKREILKKDEENDQNAESIHVMKAKILNSLRSELAKMDLEDKNKASLSKTVEPGWQCSRNGCSKEYVDASSNATCCQYHPGAPVFHEGMKFWSCCERKTSDFTSFLGQVGCEKADCCDWVHPSEAREKAKAAARYDFHQTTDTIYCNVYCKGIIPNETKVIISDRRVDINVCFGVKKTKMSLRVSELWAKVVPGKSRLTLAGTKLELGLNKKSKVQWKSLEAKEDGAKVHFGMPEKMPDIWPEATQEVLPEEVKKVLTVKEVKKKAEPVKTEDPESDLDIDDIQETEWS